MIIVAKRPNIEITVTISTVTSVKHANQIHNTATPFSFIAYSFVTIYR
jgi:hypothetical protein